ncbi:MAG: hypothetical protein ABIF87_00965 [Pseudomonadota bacterium]
MTIIATRRLAHSFSKINEEFPFLRQRQGHAGHQDSERSNTLAASVLRVVQPPRDLNALKNPVDFHNK